MKTSAYLIQTDDLDGPVNMAIDEVLWGEAAHGTPFLRLYGWADRPALSLGYFQCSQEVRCQARWRGLPYVRRLTGGGAIVHDHELTYSLALPAHLAPKTSELYRLVHGAIACALTELGIPATVETGAKEQGQDSKPIWAGWGRVFEPPAVRHTSAAEAGGAKTRPQPLRAMNPSRHFGTVSEILCFRRGDRFAVRVCGVKVLGSAQRQQPESVLMHGSLLMAGSSAAPEIPGLHEVLGRVFHPEVLGQAVHRAVQTALSLDLRPADLPPALLDQATELANSKYRTAAWNDHKRYVPAKLFPRLAHSELVGGMNQPGC